MRPAMAAYLRMSRFPTPGFHDGYIYKMRPHRGYLFLCFLGRLSKKRFIPDKEIRKLADRYDQLLDKYHVITQSEFGYDSYSYITRFADYGKRINWVNGTILINGQTKYIGLGIWPPHKKRIHHNLPEFLPPLFEDNWDWEPPIHYCFVHTWEKCQICGNDFPLPTYIGCCDNVQCKMLYKWYIERHKLDGVTANKIKNDLPPSQMKKAFLSTIYLERYAKHLVKKSKS